MDRAPDEPMDVMCACGATFCFNCKEEAHRPVRGAAEGHAAASRTMPASSRSGICLRCAAGAPSSMHGLCCCGDIAAVGQPVDGWAASPGHAG